MVEKPSVISLCDLDDSLFQSARKAVNSEGAIPVVRSSSGREIAFQTREQQALSAWLFATTRVIPTTGRSSKWVSRVALPFSDYAICSFGGVILTPEGQPEPRWFAHIEQQCRAYGAEMEALAAICKQEVVRLGYDVRVKISTDQGLPLSISLKHNKRDEAETAALAECIKAHMPTGWWMHLNGRNMAVCPPFLGKDIAVQWFLAEIAGAHDLVVSLGDSLSDLVYMALSDMALVPVKPQSQIFAALENH